MQIERIVKRNGDVVAFDPDALIKWASWASCVDVDWFAIVCDAYQRCPDRCSTQELHQAMIDACLQREDMPHLKMAGRLLIGDVYKKAYGGHNKIPTLFEMYEKMTGLGLWDAGMGYTKAELEELELHLDHEKDLTLTHTEVKQISEKYAISNRLTRTPLESPQMTYMRVAMGNVAEKPDRIKHAIRLYQHLSNKKINAPTPMMVNLGTPMKGLASCAVYTTHDTADSLAAGDHIAYMMTVNSAGIGAHIKSRSKGDGVRKNTIKHQGKLPYMRVLESVVHANLQNGRGGAATDHFTCLDPEVETLLVLKNPMTVDQQRIKGIDYSFGYNLAFLRAVANGKQWALFSYGDAPDLHEALYDKDQSNFDRLYESYLTSQRKRTMVNARDLMLQALTQSIETRMYLHRTDGLNRHTPFKETIYSSNLCVAPETKILTKDGHLEISKLENCEVEIWNGHEWSSVIVRKTGTNRKLIRIQTSEGELECTPYHRFHLDSSPTEAVEARNLLIGDLLVRHDDVCPVVIGMFDDGRYDDTYCFTEPKRGMGVFNGLLTGQCQEIALVTRGYDSVDQLYQSYPINRDGTIPEIGLCSLAAIVVSNVSDDEYEDVAYYAAMMVDNVIDLMDYPFESLARTAKARRSMGIGITGLATHLATNYLSYTSRAGKTEMHRTAERHYYWLLKASLRLGQERGNAEWMHKTLWPDGWLPLDTYTKSVDDVCDATLYFDWETLRRAIIANGGIRNSVLVAHMPCESSSHASYSTNGLYPIRQEVVIKTSPTTGKAIFIAPFADEYPYQTAWGIPAFDMIDGYGVYQKFTDQAISADLYNDYSEKSVVSGRDLIAQALHMHKRGLKTRYYVNSSAGVTAELCAGCSV